MGSDADSTLTTICRGLRATFNVDSCVVLLPSAHGLLPRAWSGSLETAPIRAFEHRGATTAFTGGRLGFLNDTPARRRPRLVAPLGLWDRRVSVIYVPLRVGSRDRPMEAVVALSGHRHDSWLYGGTSHVGPSRPFPVVLRRYLHGPAHDRPLPPRVMQLRHVLP